MNSIHRQLRGGHAGAWRTLLVVVAALGAATSHPIPAAAEGPPGVEGVVLQAPTGVRSGVQVGDPTAPPDVTTIDPFDTFGRDPSLAILDVGGGGWAAWEVLATPAASPGTPPTSLATGVAEVPLEVISLQAPPPGAWLVTAALVAGAEGPSGTWAWHLVIPDRSLPEALDAPDIVLFGGGATVIAERGSGCYLGQCGDIGGLPADRTLPAIRLERRDEPIALTLSDGSGMVRVTAHAILLGVDETQPVQLVDGDAFAATNVLLVPPPSIGRWHLEILVTYSDGRGDQAGYARVIVP